MRRKSLRIVGGLMPARLVMRLCQGFLYTR